MADLLGPSAGIEGALTDWGNYWGQVDQRARLRYDHREARDEREREHQYQLERARSNQGAYAGRAGLFENADARFGNMGPRNVPIAEPTTAGLTPEQIAGNAQVAQYMTRPGNAGPALVSETADTENYNFDGALAALPRLIVSEQAMTPMQRTRWTQLRRAYGRLTRGQMSVEDYRARLEVAVREGIVDPSQLNIIEARQRPNRPHEVIDVTQGSPSATATIPPAYENTQTPQVPESNDPLFRGPNTQTYPGGLEPPDAEDVASRAAYQDTSGPLAPTPEMQMLQTIVEDNMRLANIAARHGRNTEAEQHFAQALQGQAAYLQQARLVQMRAASQGHQTALADLLGLYSGRPPGTTRLQQVGNTNQYNLQVLTPSGQWTNTPAGPFTYEQLFQTARGLVDRESVMAESEANSEYIRASIAAGAQIRVAEINAFSDQQDQYVRAMIAAADNATQERIARGEGRLIVDSTNNRAYYEYNDAVTGEPIIIELGERDVRVADTNGRRTERQVTGRRITGITGVRGN